MRVMHARSQAALDFMVSYGLAILIITIALYVVFSLNIFNPQLSSIVCTPAPGFFCQAYSLDANSTLTIKLVQATGGTIDITGAACSKSVNSGSDAPAYGNVNVLGYSSSYYPNSDIQNGLTIYSDSSNTIQVYCFDGNGKATGGVGYTFSGYFWINYTVSDMPPVHYIKRVATFTVVYT